MSVRPPFNFYLGGITYLQSLRMPVVKKLNPCFRFVFRRRESPGCLQATLQRTASSIHAPVLHPVCRFSRPMRTVWTFSLQSQTVKAHCNVLEYCFDTQECLQNQGACFCKKKLTN